MTGQDVILLLLPVQLHDGREHKQVIPTPTASNYSSHSSSQAALLWQQQDVIRFLFLLNLQYSKHIQVILALMLQLGLALCPSSSTMAAQDVILLLLPVPLHDDREHKQVVMPAPTAPTSPRTLSK